MSVSVCKIVVMLPEIVVVNVRTLVIVACSGPGTWRVLTTVGTFGSKTVTVEMGDAGRRVVNVYVVNIVVALPDMISA